MALPELDVSYVYILIFNQDDIEGIYAEKDLADLAMVDAIATDKKSGLDETRHYTIIGTLMYSRYASKKS